MKQVYQLPLRDFLNYLVLEELEETIKKLLEPKK
jgi:hypothetical protein